MPFGRNERLLVGGSFDMSVGARFNQLKAAFLQGSFQIDRGCRLRLRCRHMRLWALEL